MTSASRSSSSLFKHDAFVDDGGHAFEQLAAGAELAILRARARREATIDERGADDARPKRTSVDCEMGVHGIALLSRLGRCLR